MTARNGGLYNSNWPSGSEAEKCDICTKMYPAVFATGFKNVNCGCDITVSQVWESVPAPEESDRPLLQTEGLFPDISRQA